MLEFSRKVNRVARGKANSVKDLSFLLTASKSPFILVFGLIFWSFAVCSQLSVQGNPRLHNYARVRRPTENLHGAEETLKGNVYVVYISIVTFPSSIETVNIEKKVFPNFCID